MLKYMTKYFDFDKVAVEALQKSSNTDGVPSTYEIKARFTDDSPDSHGDIITREGTTNALPDYREWRNIRYMHEPKAVGLAKNIGENDGADLDWNEVIVKLVDKETIHQVQEGVLKGLSVGILFNPFDTNSCEFMEDGGWKIKEYLLAEISVVDHPAHPNASVIEASLSEVGDERQIQSFSKELKNAIRSAASTEELVPLLKSLSIEKEVNMEDQEKLQSEAEEEVLEKEGRDWDKERASSDVEEDVIEEEEKEEEAEAEEEAEEDAEEEIVPEAEEEAEAEVEAEPVDEEEEAEELEVEPELEVEEEIEEEEEEEELSELPEEEEEVSEEVAEEEEEEEQLPESNETEELSIKVNEEEDVLDRLARLEAMLEKLLNISTEDTEVADAEAEANTQVVTEQEEKDLAETELTTPSNRKANMEISAPEVEEEDSGPKKTTFRSKRADAETRIRRVLDNLEL